MLCLKTCQELFSKILTISQIFRFNPFSSFKEKCIQKNFKFFLNKPLTTVLSWLDENILTFTLILRQIYNDQLHDPIREHSL